jgi:hypothetical protein
LRKKIEIYIFIPFFRTTQNENEILEGRKMYRKGRWSENDKNHQGN